MPTSRATPSCSGGDEMAVQRSVNGPAGLAALLVSLRGIGTDTRHWDGQRSSASGKMSERSRSSDRSGAATPSPLDPHDSLLFRSQVGAVRPVRHNRVEPTPARAAPIPRMTQADEQAVLRESLESGISPDLETGEDLTYVRPGLQRQILRKLRRGRFAVGAHLDLHGMRTEEAFAALRDFVRDARSRGITCVRIVHGKGLRSSNRGPVLKPKVARWLRQWDPVLAFCSAAPADGGTGALYVLLRRP